MPPPANGLPAKCQWVPVAPSAAPLCICAGGAKNAWTGPSEPTGCTVALSRLDSRVPFRSRLRNVMWIY